MSKERISKKEVQQRLLAAYRSYRNGSRKPNSQAERELEHAYRLAIANGNLMGGNADRMNEIHVVITGNGNAKVLYKGFVIGYWRPGPEVEEIRSKIEGLEKEVWFQNEIQKF